MIVAAIIALYLPVALGGALVYGYNVGPNVALSLGDSWLVDVANLLMASHLLMAFLIVTNPVNQELEHIFALPHGKWSQNNNNNKISNKL